MGMFGGRGRPMSAGVAARLLDRPHVPGTTLRRILYRAPEPYKTRAWRRLLATENPRDLQGVLYSAPREYRIRCANLLIKAGCALNNVLTHAPRSGRARAASVLLGQGATEVDLRQIILYAPEPYRGRAWARLSEGTLTPETRTFLKEVLGVSRFPKAYKAKAVDLLLPNANGSELSAVVCRASEPQKSAAAQRLIDLECTLEDVIVYAAKPLKGVAWECLRALPPGAEKITSLHALVKNVVDDDLRSYQLLACQAILESPDPPEDALISVMQCTRAEDDQKREAARRLLLGSPSLYVLGCVARHAPEGPFAEEAQGRLPQLRPSAS